MLRTAALLLCCLVPAAAAAAKPCYGVFDATRPLEEACFTVLQNGTGGLQLREYDAASAAGGVTLATYSVPAAVTVYQEALEMATYYVIGYFTRTGATNDKNASLLTSRTVPLALRPPSPEHNAWLGFMALAPSVWPPGGSPAPPAPTYGVTLEPLGLRGGGAAPLALAVQRATSSSEPQPSDFDALCAALRAGVAAQLPGWAVDAASPYTYTHARFFGFTWTGPYDYECIAGVTKQ